MPHLAETWGFSDDRLTLTLKLRQGVLFHSGRPLSAEEAKWSIEFAQDAKNGAQASGEMKGVQTRVVDASTLELKLPDVLPHIFSLLASVFVIDPQSDLAANAAGTGPFKLDGLTPGDEMRLVRNAQYWQPNRPYLDKVSIKAYPDISAGLVAVESGAVGIAQCPESELQRLSGGGQTATTVLPAPGNPSTGNWEIVVNVANPPLSDQRVRQAINLAVDRKRFTDTLLYGLTDPSYVIWPKHSSAWDAAMDVGEFNLDKARQLLTDAGYPNGFDTLIQGSTAYPALNQFAQIVQSDLSKIGVNARIEILESSQATTMLAQATASALFFLQYANADQDPAQLFTAFPFRTTGNTSHFESDAYRQQVGAARREPDMDKRIGLYRQIAAFVKDQAFVLPLANRVVPWVTRSNVHGITATAPSPDIPLLETIWVD